MDQAQRELIARKLTEARLSATPIERPHLESKVEFQQVHQEEAYAIQELGIKHRVSELGETPVGLKMGLTSLAKRAQMNLDSPLYGELTDKMQIPNGGEFSLKKSIHPKIEPEVAFFLGRELKGHSSVTEEEAWAACEGVCAVLEILDSRYLEFKYFSMEDVIADNSSSSHFVLGPFEGDLKKFPAPSHPLILKLKMSLGGGGHNEVIEGTTEAISGNPLTSLVDLCRLLEKRGRSIPRGSVVLAGAATRAVPLAPGMKIGLEVENLPPVHVHVHAGLSS